ncbi:YheE family protein [Mesobacillus zeae]|uniref:YheE family protein n=1 Tax=Mesobacillus zeae TaxID=1917180 RepID=A0A398B5D6_9BACI|nr:YheE family protein [Mesobacillus zeae]RID84644.1 hypothetical protein D1970_12200 [Mesobacillus zeae]
MLTHFQYKPLFENKELPGWRFSFYFRKERYAGVYHPDGKIEWVTAAPPEKAEDQVTGQIHELMLFHVYDK